MDHKIILKIFPLFIACYFSLCLPTQAEEKSWRNEFVDKEIQNICDKTESLALPTQDLPSEADKINLKNCSSRNLYYGISVPEDHTAARKCAIMELNSKNTEFVGGASILMMIYANGEGVKRNLDIAKKMACEMWSAPYELALRINHLSSPEPEPIDMCDHITSGVMAGFCATISSDMHEEAASSKLKEIVEKWPAEHQKMFRRLNTSATKYFESHASKEIDMSGTMRGAFYINEKDYMLNEFRKLIYDFENNKKLSYIKANVPEFDKDLNDTYHKVIHRKFDEISGVSKNGIKETELLWIKYRDDWVKFLALHYPTVDTEIIKTKLTIERTEILENIPTPISME